MMRLRRAGDDSGNIMIAMLGIMVITFIVVIGMTQMVLSEKVTRHDRNFEQSLAAAEGGLGQLVTQIKASPYASTIAPVSGTDPATHTSWTATATGGAGHWVLNATGTANGSATPVTRTITQTIEVSDLLSHPLFATTSMTLGGGDANGVDTYSSAADSSVCNTGLISQTMGWSNARMCTPASPAQGRMGTNGPFTMPSASLDNVAGVDIYATGTAGYPSPSDTGSCAGDATTCASTEVVRYEDSLDFPLSNQCSSGIGAGATAYDGSLALAANAVYSFTDVTLNATAVANLANVSGSRLVICFSGRLDVVPTVPLNSEVQTVVPARLKPRAPSTLVLISTSGSPTVRLNAGLSLPSNLSAVVYAPNAACSATAHVDLYGMMVCSTISAPSGISVHYDTQVGNMAFDQPVKVSGWRER